MKKVFAKTSDVCAVWAKGEQNEARTGSNTSFRDGILRSYGTPIASIVKTPEGERVALISSDQWSSGTSKVQGEAWAAANEEGLPRFRVPAILSAETSFHDKNLADFQRRAEEMLGRLDKGLLRSADNYRSNAKRAIADAEEYAALFGLSWTYTGRNPDDVRHKGEVA